MSFRLFIYYCAICGGWAALLTWGLVMAGGLRSIENVYLSAALIAAFLGLLLGGVIGLLDAVMNSTGFQRVLRVIVAMSVGLIGAFLGGLIGEGLHQALVPGTAAGAAGLVVGWVVVGVFIGVCIGVYDILRSAASGGGDLHLAIRKIVNGVCGGLLGGLLGGLISQTLHALTDQMLPRSRLAFGLVAIGLLIGLFIGLAQVLLKEAWVKVEKGFRAGRELILSKDETTVGKGEACDIGLFGDGQLDKLHARIVLKGNRYLLADNGTQTGTYLNDRRINGPTPLKSGDEIRVGNSILRFGERQKRK
jgi:hypothetical protein